MRPADMRRRLSHSEGISLDPGDKAFYTYRGLAYYGLGDLQSARA
jgi:hypothetical protein